jgi:photosystem II stability/assembly factor-like uncharacterized protein
LAIALTALFATPLQSGQVAGPHDAAPIPYVWKPVAIGGGGFITGYAADRSGATRVIRSDVYGAYLWSNEDDRWKQLIVASAMPPDWRGQRRLSEGVFEIAVAPGDKDRIYVAMGATVFRSANRGRTFSAAAQMPSPLRLDANSPFRTYGPFMAVSPVDENLVLLGTPADGLLRSEDGGGAWTKAANIPAAGPEGILLWFAPVKARGGKMQILAMVSGRGLFASDDDGRTFHSAVAAGAPQPMTLKQGAFDSHGDFFGVDPDAGKVWRLHGEAWTEIGAALSNRPLAAIAITPADDRIFVFDEGGRAFRSDSHGDRWRELARPVRIADGDPPWLAIPGRQSYFAIGQVLVDPVTPNRLIAGAGTGVFFADLPPGDAQIPWTSQVRGIEELVANDIVQPAGRAPLFAAWDFGVHGKPDLDRWSETYGPKERVLIAAQQLDWCASRPDFLVTNASDTRMGCCAQDGDAVLAGFSEDAGRSWSKFPTLPQPPGTRADDPWRMAFGAIAVAANDPDNIVWEPTFDRSPFYTKDRGASWRRVRLPGESLPLTGSHEKYFYNRKTLAADRVLPNTFYLVHSGEGDNASLAGLWRTADGGETWKKVFAGEIAPGSRFSARLKAAPERAGELFFTSALTEGPDLALRRSHDGGASWSVVAGVDSVEDVGFGKAARAGAFQSIYIAGRVHGVYGLWRSDNDAASWVYLGQFPLDSLDQVNVVAGSLDEPGKVFVGFKGSGFAYGVPAKQSKEAHAP